MDVAQDLKPWGIIVIGDFVDCWSISSYGKDPTREAQLDQELEKAREMRAQLDALKAKKKVFCEGNHEERLKRYLRDKAPELFSMITIPKLLDLKGWEFVPYRGHTRIGKVHYTHDAGAAQSSRYATFRALDTYQHSVVVGHQHRLQYAVEGNATGECKLAAQFGWLGDVNRVDYMHEAQAKKNWALGFGVGTYDTQTRHTFWQPVPIVDGRCIVDATPKLYKVPRLRK